MVVSVEEELYPYWYAHNQKRTVLSGKAQSGVMMQSSEPHTYLSVNILLEYVSCAFSIHSHIIAKCVMTLEPLI